MISDNNGMAGKREQGGDDSIELFGMLRRRRKILVGTFLLGLGLALAYQLLARRQYEAKFELMVMKRDSSVPANGVGAKGEVDGSELTEELLATHMKWLSSRKTIKAALELLSKTADVGDETPMDAGEAGAGAMTATLDELHLTNSQKYNLIGLESLIEAQNDDIDPVDYIVEKLHVDVGGEGSARDASVLVATFEDPEQDDCARILSAILAAYQTDVSTSFAGDTNDIIRVQRESRDMYAQELTQAQDEYRRFRETTTLWWDNDKARNTHQERLATLAEDLRDVKKRLSETKARADVISEVLSSKQLSGVSDIDRLALLSDRETQRLKLLFDVTKGDPNTEEFQADQPVRSATAKAQYEELLALMLRERSLLADFGADHPLVQITREKLAVMRSFLEENAPKDVQNPEKTKFDPKEMLVTYERLLQNDLLQDRKLEENILADIEKESGLARALAADELHGQLLLDKIETKKQLQREAIQALGEVARAKDFGGFKVQVLENPETQQKPSWPDAKIVVALGGIGGLVLGFLISLLADLTDSTFRNPDDVENVLGLPVMAHVPMLPPNMMRDEKLGNIVPEICVAHRPKSKEAEVFRSLRTSLFFTAASTKMQVIQVTSPSTGDGKSTITANVACAIARSGKKVLLVDCDLRRPRVASIFGLPREVGLSTVLTGKSEIPDVIKDSGLEHLSVMPAGPIPADPAELLTSAKFGECVEVLRTKFDYVLLDTPPMLAVSDPGIVANLADGVILTLRILKNGRGASVRAKELLEELDANLLGTIVNCSTRFSRDYGYSDYRYAESYSYQYRDDKYYEQEKQLGYSRKKRSGV